jgi:hypothetical protein
MPACGDPGGAQKRADDFINPFFHLHTYYLKLLLIVE